MTKKLLGEYMKSLGLDQVDINSKVISYRNYHRNLILRESKAIIVTMERNNPIGDQSKKYVEYILLNKYTEWLRNNNLENLLGSDG